VNGAQPPAAVHEDVVAGLKKLADAGIFAGEEQAWSRTWPTEHNLAAIMVR
jgi:hypothetical protein